MFTQDELAQYQQDADDEAAQTNMQRGKRLRRVAINLLAMAATLTGVSTGTGGSVEDPLDAPVLTWDGETLDLLPDVGISYEAAIDDIITLRRSTSSDFSSYEDASDTVESLVQTLDFDFGGDWDSGTWYVKCFYTRDSEDSPDSNTVTVTIENDFLDARFSDDRLIIRDSVTGANAYDGTPQGKLTVSVDADGTFVNASGVITQATADNLRIDYDPNTLECKGLLVEEARTNICLYSSDFSNAAWLKTRISASADATTSPDGTVNADKFVEDGTAASTHVMRQDIAFTSGTTYTLSVFAKAAERTQIALSFGAENGVFPSNDAVFYTLTGSGSTSLISGTPTYDITAFPNGWYRCRITKVAAASANAFIRCWLASGSQTSYSGDGVSGAYFWGAQVEAGFFVSSYIPTAGSSVARAADGVSILTSAMPASATAWTTLLEAIPGVTTPTADATARYAFALSNNSANEANVFTRAASSANVGPDLIDGGVSVATIAANASTTGTAFKYAFAVAANDLSGSFNGGTVATDASATLPTIDRLYFGANGAGSAGFWSGHIKRLVYLKRRATNTELVSLST